jgi:hypothetical protein
MEEQAALSTGPKPFVFVLMPFDSAFRDVYQFGIKGAAEDIGAYAERVDEQIFDEGILDRIFNQINKADVVVADMTGRNPNVFYEVGYAHALNRVVVLLTQRAEDIPFDLKHRPHIVYAGSIERLRADLRSRLVWAIEESSRRRQRAATQYRLAVSLDDTDVPEAALASTMPSIPVEVPVHLRMWADLEFHVRNEGPEMSDAVSHVYLLLESGAPITVIDIREEARKESREFLGKVSERTIVESRPVAKSWLRPSETDRLRLRMAVQFKLQGLPAIPPGAAEVLETHVMLPKGGSLPWSGVALLRFHTRAGQLDFPFRITAEAEGPHVANQ